MQPTLYNNSLWVRTEQRHSVIYHFKVLTLPAWNAEALSQRGCCPCLHAGLEPPSPGACRETLPPHQPCWALLGGHTGMENGVCRSCSPLPAAYPLSPGMQFPLLQVFAHPLIASSGCAGEGVEWPVQGSRAHLPAWVFLLHPWVQRILCCCRRSEIAPLNSKLMQESGKMSWSW